MKQRLLVVLVLLCAAMPEYSLAQGIEISSKRTWNSKTYLNTDNNTLTVEVSSGYLHFQDANGDFQNIDPRLVTSPDSNHYEVTRGLYYASFGFDLNSAGYPIDFELPDKTRFRAKPMRLAYYSRSSKQLVPIQEVQNAKGVVDGYKIRYPEIFTGVDVEYQYVDAKLKQFVYLSQKARDNLPDPQSLGLNPNNTDLVLVTRIEVPDSLEAFAKNQRVSSKGPTGKIRLDYEGEDQVDFRNIRGQGKFSLPADFAFAKAGRDSASEESSSHRMWRRISSEGLDNFMHSGVALKWLEKQPPGTIVLDPSVAIQPGPEGKDTFIYKSNNGDDNHGAMGQLQIGPDQATYERRGLISFDLSAIPSTAVITSATFQLFLYANTGTAASFTIEAHKMLRNWVEGTGTAWNGGNASGCDWNYADQPNTVLWNAAGMQSGTDYHATVAGTALINLSDDEFWKSWPIALSTVQEWVTTPSSNFGLALVSAAGDAGKYLVSQFYSSDNTAFPDLRPRLLINYSVNPVADITYDALSRPTTITYANGVTETNQYDSNRGWLTRRDYQKSGANIYYFNSTGATDFDKAGNLKHVEYKHKTDAAQTMDYAYDRLYRLTTFTPSGSSAKTYSYDPNGNLNTFEGQTYVYNTPTPINNQLKEVKNGAATVTTYQYDKAGRAKLINSTALTYDFRSNLLTHGTTNAYSYDAFGQHIKKTEGSISKYYITSGPQVLAEYAYNAQTLVTYLEAEYIYALGRMITKLDPAKGYLWFYVDHLGSTRLVDGPDSQTDMRRDYSPFGQAYLAAGTEQSMYQFTGKELDNATGLYCFGARYYERSTGRWLTADPISSEFSPYSYVYNRPLNFIDRFGLGGDLPDEDEEGGPGSGGGYYYIGVPAFMFWGGGSGGFPGGAGIGVGGGGALGYRSASGGRLALQTRVAGFVINEPAYTFDQFGQMVIVPGSYGFTPVYESQWVFEEAGLEPDNTMEGALGTGMVDAYVAGKTIATRGKIWQFSSTRRTVIVKWPRGSGMPGVMNRLPAGRFFAQASLRGGAIGGIVSGVLTAAEGGDIVDITQSTGIGVISSAGGSYTGAYIGTMVGGPAGLIIGTGLGFATGTILDYTLNQGAFYLRRKF